MTERKILGDPIGVCGVDLHGGPKASTAFGAFMSQKMPFAGSRTHHFPFSGDFKSLGHRFSGFNSFGASHNSTGSKKSAKYRFMLAPKQVVFSFFRPIGPQILSHVSPLH